MSNAPVLFLGGRFGGYRARLSDTPPVVRLGRDDFYERVDNPETGEFIGVYTPTTAPDGAAPVPAIRQGGPSSWLRRAWRRLRFSGSDGGYG